MAAEWQQKGWEEELPKPFCRVLTTCLHSPSGRVREKRVFLQPWRVAVPGCPELTC